MNVNTAIKNLSSAGESLDVLVLTGERDHCNMDSLPLRFGEHFDEDTVVKVSNQTSHEVQYNERTRQDRHKISCDLEIKGKTYAGVTAVISDTLTNGYPVLITVWRNDSSTELGLSDLLKRLRIRGQVTPQILMDLNPSYDDGLLKTRDDLVIALRYHDEISRQQVEAALNESVEQLTIENRAKDELIAQMKAEREAMENEKAAAARESGESKIAYPSEVKILKQVLVNQQYRNSPIPHTILVFEDGSTKQMKVSTWDPNDAVTQKAQTLIGQPVITTCWDPVYEPGKWSRMGYFKNIYLASSVDESAVST